MKDMVRRGQAHHRAKLTEKDVTAIRTLYFESPDHPTMAQLAARFGITSSSVRMILIGKAWAHVPGPTLTPDEDDS